jgi:succinate-semialdehyde dehydrogenase / glutarate-semialdehyde dehydrogenase
MREDAALPETPAGPTVGGTNVQPSLIVGGQPVEAIDGERYAITNPATGEIVGSAPLGRSKDAIVVGDVAAAALASWGRVPVAVRANILERAIDLVESHVPDLAVLLTREQGKPLAEAQAECATFITRMRTFVRLASMSAGGRIPTLSTRPHDADATHETGVVAALVAWNFPIGLLAKKIGPALLAGRTVIVKPAYTTPLATLRVVSLMNAAGLPAGVLNCVTGRGDDAGSALVGHPAVSRVHLTGSDTTGATIRRTADTARQELLLGLGGSDPMIVCRDADLPNAVEAAVTGRLRNAGQVCTAVKRLYVAEEVYSEFVGELQRRVQLYEPGNGLNALAAPRTRMGPLHTAAGRGLVEEQLACAVDAGAEVITGGRRPRTAETESGYFFEPTLVTGVLAGDRLVTEEVFGPVLPIVRTASVDDAIELANKSRWHLSAFLWTGSRETARHAAAHIHCQRLWVNRLPF